MNTENVRRRVVDPTLLRGISQTQRKKFKKIRIGRSKREIPIALNRERWIPSRSVSSSSSSSPSRSPPPSLSSLHRSAIAPSACRRSSLRIDYAISRSVPTLSTSIASAPGSPRTRPVLSAALLSITRRRRLRKQRVLQRMYRSRRFQELAQGSLSWYIFPCSVL